jgi:hypothetical protein
MVENIARYIDRGELAALNTRRGPRETYLPYAIGDGTEQTLHIYRGKVVAFGVKRTSKAALIEPDL